MSVYCTHTAYQRIYDLQKQKSWLMQVASCNTVASHNASFSSSGWLVALIERNWHILHSRSKGHMAKQKTHSSSTKQVLLQWITTCFYHFLSLSRGIFDSCWLNSEKYPWAKTCNERCCSCRLGSLQIFLALFVASFQFSLNSIYFRLIPSNSIYVTPSNLVPWCHTLSLRNSAEGLSGLQLFYPCFQRLANHSHHWRRNWLARHCISAWAFPFRCKFVYL